MSSASSKNFVLSPLLWLAVSFAIGILAANFANLDWRVYLSGAIIAAILSAIYIKNKSTSVFILISFFFLGGFYLQIQRHFEPTNSLKHIYDLNQINSGDPVEIEGAVEGKPELSVGGFSLILNAEKLIYKQREINTSGRIRLFASIRNESIRSEYEALRLRHGKKIRVATNLNREQRFLNPGGVSFTDILDQKDIYATGSIKSPLLIERLGSEQKFSLFSWVFDYRQGLIKTIQRKFNVSTSGILIASMLGNRRFLTKDTAEIFRDGGTFHVLVISGLHITFIGGILLLIVRLFTKKRLGQFVITTAALWIYSFAVGAEIPVVRAALMFTILLFSFVIYRRGTLLNALGFCGFLILLWRPEDVFSQSFHLTFASLAGIIGVAFPLLEKLRSIGGWMPSAETPFPPEVSKYIKIFCETLYWSERKWRKHLSENVWDCKITKSDYGKWLEERGLQKLLRWIFEGIVVTTAVQIFLLPFLILYFHRLSFAAVLLNLWVGAFVVIQNVTSLVALILAQISDIFALPIVKLTEVFNWFLLAVPQIFIENNFASIRVPIYSGNMKAIYFLYFLPLLGLTYFLNKWSPFKREEKESLLSTRRLMQFYLIAFLILSSLIIFHPHSSPPSDGKLTVDFLDVGQGDSSLVTFPNGETMLIDGGGRFNFDQQYIEQEDGGKELFERDAQGVGETVVSELLWEKGYSKVDYLLATHADADHIQGLVNVAKNFEVKTAFIGTESPEDEDFIEFTKMLERKNVQIVKLSRGDSFEIGGVKIGVLNPVSNQEKQNTSTNNESLVIRLVLGGRKFLFTGDIEKETENELLANDLLLEADIVKVAHHGSRTSSTQEFIDATKAEYAIIPVGRKSRFGHPHSEVVERWENSGAKVITTGERGTVTVSTDGQMLEIQTLIKK